MALTLAATCYFQHTNERFITAHVNCENLRSYRALNPSIRFRLRFQLRRTGRYSGAGFADAGYVMGPHGRQYELLLRRK